MLIRMAPTRPDRRGPSRRSPKIDKLTHQRGIESEMRLLESCRLPSRPSWMHRARLATRIEDRSGIDIVVESDVGALLVQVKSSNAGKQHFRRRPLLGILSRVGVGGHPSGAARSCVRPRARRPTGGVTRVVAGAPVLTNRRCGRKKMRRGEQVPKMPESRAPARVAHARKGRRNDYAALYVSRHARRPTV
jgi:hypothetical protein